MAKLFSKIGKLEERELPQINKSIPSVNQGSIDLKISPPAKQDVTNQLQIVGNAREKNISSLQISPKGLINADTIPLRYSFFAKPNANIQVQSPIIITYPNQISLENRLKQSGLGTTQHLAQFFLSDVYANYIKITPFKFTAELGGTTVRPFTYNPTQGGLNPILFSTPPIIGGVTPTLPIQDVRTLQGIIIVNNAASSFINITPYNLAINQGSTTPSIFLFNPIQGETNRVLFTFIPNQGSITIGVNSTLINQGSVTVTPYVFIPQQGFVTLKPYNFEPEQGGLNPTLIQGDINQGGLIPQIIGYELDKLLALVTPLLKHGTSFIDISTWQSTKVNQGLISPTQYATEIQQIDNANNSYQKNKNNIGMNPDGTFYSLPIPNPITTLNLESSEFIQNYILPQVSFPANSQATNLTNYTTLNYSNTAKRATRAKNLSTADFRQDINQQTPAPFNNGQNYTNTNVYKRLGYGDYGKGGIDRSDFTKDLGLNDTLYSDVNKVGNDLVKLRFHSVRDNETLQFRSYIKAFSEDYNVDFTDVEYVGRPDKLKIFKGNSRTGTINFIVPAGTKKEVKVMHEKLNRLAQIIYGAKYEEKGNYFVSPFINLTVGDYYSKMPVNITSLKYDTNPVEYPWEINIRPDGKVGDLFEGPQFVDVQISFNVIGHNMPLSNFNVIDTPNFNAATGQNIAI